LLEVLGAPRILPVSEPSFKLLAPEYEGVLAIIPRRSVAETRNGYLPNTKLEHNPCTNCSPLRYYKPKNASPKKCVLKVKVKLSLCLTEHHAMKTYGRVEV
jgi:hypothetical protein